MISNEETPDDDELTDERLSLDNDKASGEGTADKGELSDKRMSINDGETSNEGTFNGGLSDESVYVDGEGNTDDEIMSQIKINNPSMTSLSIGENDYYSFDEECADLGRVIGRNTHLKDLCVATEWGGNFNDLFRGLASNQSIKKLTLGIDYGDNTCFDDKVANIVANGIIRNAPIKHLAINGAHNMTHVGWLAIFTAL
jgi:hypothetical protein